LNQRRLTNIENLEVGEKMKNLKLLCETTSENPKCHMHIPQSRKNIYVLNIIIQNIPEKKKNEKKGHQRNTQNPNATNKGTKT
jgi:hypothetical protein